MHLILGGPGCGKTTRLLRIVEEELARGVPADRIAFVAFTKAAAHEAATRAATLFRLDPARDLPWFRTIHSLAYQRLGMMRDEIVGPQDMRSFAEIVGEQLSGRSPGPDMVPGTIAARHVGDAMMQIVELGATTRRGMNAILEEMDTNGAVDRWRLARFADTYAKFKTRLGKMDFTDMLAAYARDGEPVPVDVAIIDEAQDLTAIQWDVIERAFQHTKRLYIGGDDDQAIYRWAGADVDRFLSLTDAPEILNLSYRLPWEIFRLSQIVADRISTRYAKDFRPAVETRGLVVYHNRLSSVDLRAPGSWLLLARNTYMLAEYVEYARRLGVNYQVKRELPAIQPDHVEAALRWEKVRREIAIEFGAETARLFFAVHGLKMPQLRELTKYRAADFPQLDFTKPWHIAFTGIEDTDRTYYVSCLRNGGTPALREPPRIRIDTIHGVKGAEADHVVLMTDLSARTYAAMQRAPDHEHRVFYVATTRARESLHILAPTRMMGYPLSG